MHRRSALRRVSSLSMLLAAGTLPWLGDLTAQPAAAQVATTATTAAPPAASASAAPAAAAPVTGSATAAVEFQPGERIVLLGGAFIERLQVHGHLESRLVASLVLASWCSAIWAGAATRCGAKRGPYLAGRRTASSGW